MANQIDTIKDKSLNSLKDIKNDTLGKFENPYFLKLVLLKAERLSAAIYLITDLITDNEPLKWTLRKSSTELITDISMSETESGAKGHSNVFDKLLARVSETTSLIEVAFVGGIISKMNFNILRKEFIQIKKIIEDKFQSESVDSFFISQNFFTTSDIRSSEDKANKFSSDKGREVDINKKQKQFLKDISIKDTDYNKGHKNNFYLSSLVGNQEINSETVGEQEKSVDGIKDVLYKSEQKFLSNVNNGNDKNSRHDSILKSLVKDREYSVKDILIATNLENILSEKTIQRDLIHLVSVSSLKRTGEKRWARYSLM